MPKISPEAAAKRRTHILDAARRCFATKGIHVSVAEICAEAGVSKGAFYCYFPSKDAAIEALATAHQGALNAFAEVIGADALAERLFEYAHSGNVASSRLELEAWTHSLQQPALGAIFGSNLARLNEALAKSLAGSGAIEPDEAANILLVFATGLIAVTALDMLDGRQSHQALRTLLTLVTNQPAR